MSNLENACFFVCDNWVNEIDDTVEPNYSKEHQKRIKEISGKLQKSKFYRNKKFLAVLIPAAILLVLSLSVSATVSSKMLVRQKYDGSNIAFIYKMLGLLSDSEKGNEVLTGLETGEYSISISQDDKLVVNNPEFKPVTELDFGYIPEGYIMTKKVFIVDAAGQANFDKGENHFEIHKTTENSYVPINTDDKIKRIEQGEIKYVLAYYELIDGIERYHSISWNYDGYIYEIFANGAKELSWEELLKIAKDVK